MGRSEMNISDVLGKMKRRVTVGLGIQTVDIIRASLPKESSMGRVHCIIITMRLSEPVSGTMKNRWIFTVIVGTAAWEYTNGDLYEGWFKDDKLTGRGTYITSTGHKYKGTFIDGKLNGWGLHYDKNYLVYCGYWKDGKSVPKKK